MSPFIDFIANSQSRPTVSPSMASTGTSPSGMSHMARPGGNSNDPFAKPDMQMHQQMLQQQQRMGWAPGDNRGYPMGPNQMGPHQMMPGGPQDPMNRQYSYSQNFFGAFDSESDPPKRKRGRPRKNPLKEPTTTKRKYVRKKPLPVGPGGNPIVAPGMPGAPVTTGGFGGLKNVMADPTAMMGNPMANPMGNPMDQGGSPSVYNFDEDEGDVGLQPMRPKRANSHHKKYSFGF